ncbi:MAG TPA: DnaJ domain-containing protein [Candidatus Angelobacter sp.]
MAAHTKRDYYEVLGIKHTATGQEIEGAFLKLATEYHAQGKPANTTRIVRDLIEQD